ncbi:MAG: zinc ribbon domain-containing protein [Candidatus Thorarchaeota archaeon]
MTDSDYSEEVEIGTEGRGKEGEAVSAQKDTQSIRIVDDTIAMDSTGFTFKVTSGSLSIGDFVIAMDDTEEAISATSLDPDAEVTTDPSRYIVFLEVWTQEVSATEDTELVETALDEPDTTSRVRIGFRWLALAEKEVTQGEVAEILESQLKDDSHRSLVPIAVAEVSEDQSIKVVHYTSGDSLYSDVLKLHSLIRTKDVGSKMDGDYYITAVRHKITSSGESDSTQKVRCKKCRTENDVGDQFCRNCGLKL